MKLFIYIRNEINNNELRAPIVPKDIPKLIEHGYTIYIESSKSRIYPDYDYSLAGAIITNKEWYNPLFKNALIVGLKDLPYLDKLDRHTHIYFSHSFKNQLNSEKILKSFKKSNSLLFDFEYFIHNNKRIISFGFYAGIVGCILSLLYLHNNELKNIKHFNSLEQIKSEIIIKKQIKINIIGANGNCGMGVRSILDDLSIKYDINVKKNLGNYDLIFNCTSLHPDCNEVFIDKETIIDSKLLICDISCDYTKPNNPIKLYNKPSTWEDPVIKYNNFIDIIAIDNLPSLVPKESSEYFSSKFVELLLNYNNVDWKNALSYFENLTSK